MNKSKKEAGQSEQPGNIQKATRKNGNDGPGTLESLLPAGSGERAYSRHCGGRGRRPAC